MSSSPTLIIGIGNEMRGDDAAGLLAARLLADLDLPGVGVIELPGEGTELIEAWSECETVVVIDAVRAGGKAGTIHRLDAVADPVPAAMFVATTHAFGVAQAVETARALGRLPGRLDIYGIEGAAFSQGDPMTPAVTAAVAHVVNELANRLLADLAPGGDPYAGC